MAFQSSVNINLAFGVVGELLFDGPQRVEPLLMNSSGTPNLIGYAFTKSNTTNIAQVGGAVAAGRVFAGILVDPKVYANGGTTAGTLAPNLALPDNTMGEFMTTGCIVVNVTGAANIGDQVQFNQTTGALSAVAPGAAASAGSALIPGAYIFRYPTTASGLVAIRLLG